MTRHPGLLVAIFICTGAAGCADSVSFTDLGRFGTVGSAVWLEQEVTSVFGDGVPNLHTFVLSPEPGLCDAYEQAFEEYNSSMEDLAAAFSADAQCEVWREAFEGMSRNLDDHYREDALLITLAFLEEHSELGVVGVEPTDGEYPVGPLSDGAAYLQVQRLTAEFFGWVADSFAVEDDYCSSSTTYLIPIIGFEAVWDPPEAIDFFFGTDGEATVQHRGPSKIQVGFNAQLGEDAGEVEGEFTASHCPVSIEPGGVAW